MIKELKYELTKEDLGNFVKDALCIKRYKKIQKSIENKITIIRMYKFHYSI